MAAYFLFMIISYLFFIFRGTSLIQPWWFREPQIMVGIDMEAHADATVAFGVVMQHIDDAAAKIVSR